MNRQEFQDFVAENADWFRGRLPETDESLKDAEEKLEVCLPLSLKWLLKTYGYWHATGVGALDETISLTLRMRETLHLPHQYIVLNDWGDAGLVVIDTSKLDEEGEAAFYWIGTHDVYALSESGNLSINATRYLNFAAYTQGRIDQEKGFFEDDDVRYNPAEFPEGHAD